MSGRDQSRQQESAPRAKAKAKTKAKAKARANHVDEARPKTPEDIKSEVSLVLNIHPFSYLKAWPLIKTFLHVVLEFQIGL